MLNIFYRKNKRFIIDESKLPEAARTLVVKNALYAAVYLEFIGASKNSKYSNLDFQQRLSKLNEFAENWLKERGYL